MSDKIFSRRDFVKMTALTALAFATPDFFSSTVQAANKNCRIKTRYGIFNGFIDKRGVKTWLGIPYAKPPIKNLRWHTPEKLNPSDKEFSAKKFGNSPMQDRDSVEPASLLKQSEDCLTLNIWTNSDKKNLPVMVFIHGGAFINGGSGDPLYNGANLAASGDVVIVTINYRLNIFGFMNFAGIDSDFEGTGYLGLQDQIAALTWIKENIENFGGDPDNVTIFGESAGSISAMLLMVTPAAKNLFNKVIAQSGHLSFYQDPNYSAKFAEDFMNFGGYKNMSDMMKKSARELIATYEKFSDQRDFSMDLDYMPTCDGKFLPMHPLRALKDGAARGIKLLTGTMQEEYRYWTLYYDETFVRNMPEIHARFTPVMYEGEFFYREELYNTWQKNHTELDEVKRYFEFANQLDWRIGHELVAEYQSAFDDVYFYLFNQKSPVENLGSCHALDLPFVFGNPSPEIEPNPSAKLIRQVQAAWVSFATTGKPKSYVTPLWKNYSAEDRETMVINDVAWICRKDWNTENLAALRQVYENNLLN